MFPDSTLEQSFKWRVTEKQVSRFLSTVYRSDLSYFPAHNLVDNDGSLGIPVWITIIVDVMLLTIIYTLVISSDVAKTAIEITEEKVQIKTAFLKSVKADIDILLSEEEDLEIKKELDKLSNDIKYSDPVSSSELEEIEQLIIDKIADFSTIGEHKTYQVAKIRELVKQRNIKCRALK